MEQAQPLLSNGQVVGAMIGAAASVVAAIIAGVVAWRNASRAERLTKAQQAASETAQALATTTATYEVQEYTAVTTLTDDGSGEHIRAWVGLQVRQVVTNLKIPCKFMFSEGGKGGSPVVTALPNSKIGAHFESTTEKETIVEGYVVLEGMVTPTTGFVGFEVKQQFKGGFSLTKREVLARYKDSPWQLEYVSSSITVPSKILRRSVNLPPSHDGKTTSLQAVVFIGDGEIVDATETQRVQNNFAVLNNSATLNVANPRVGLRYAISWMPPDV